MSTTDNNKRIAKNTIMLYIRMIVLMIVSIFTAGIALRVLGEVDYGIRNVVGGIIVAFGWISNMLSSSMGRYFAVEMGRGNDKKLNQYFCISIICYIAISIIVLLLAETLGLWFLKTKMTIPEERMTAALWIYQSSVFVFIIKLLAAPYTSIIINREHMSIYAWVSILEVVFQLGYLYLLVIVNMDKLVFCAICSAVTSLIVTLIYPIYARSKFAECKYHWFWDRAMFVDMIKYSGWSLFGAFSGVARNQGINILLNVFFNPVVNAARGIAYSINSALDQFVTNFSTATRPQIIKYYGAGERNNMMKLLYRSSLLCYYLMLVLSMPVFIEISFILRIWLGEVPENTELFTRLVLLTSLIESLSFPIMAAVSATGKIKAYQLITGGLLIANLPISYIVLKLGGTPQSTMYIAIGIAIASQLSRIIFMKKLHGMSIREYFTNVLLRIIPVTIIPFVVAIAVSNLMPDGWIRLFVVCLITTISIGLSMIMVGLNSNDRKYIISIAKKKISRRGNE